jgi:hypothetical protein
MPIYDLGYRHWEGTPGSRWTRWLAIARTGILLNWRSKLLRRLLYLSWMPLLYYGPLFFLLSRATNFETTSILDELAGGLLKGYLGEKNLDAFQADPVAFRSDLWSMMFLNFFSWSQWILVMLITALVGPPLLSNDVRTRAFLVYFSRPIGLFDYILGKLATVFFYVSFVTLLPAAGLYLVSIAASPSLEVVANTWTVALRIVPATLVVCIPAALLVLALSSLTSESRYPAFAWLGICLFGVFAYFVIMGLRPEEGVDWAYLVSFWDTTLTALRGIFPEGAAFMAGLPAAEDHPFWEAIRRQPSPLPAFWALGLLSLSCLAVLWRRISAPIRI